MADAPTTERDGKQEDPRAVKAREESGGDRGLEMVNHAAQGAELDTAEEREALDWLLGDRVTTEHDIPVEYETPDGMRKLTFVVRGVDARKIDEIEQRNISQTGKMDTITAAIEIVAENAVAIVDRSGRKVELSSAEFRTVKRRNRNGEVQDFTHAAIPNAIEERFRDQLGMIVNLATEMRRVAGFTGDRVGSAQRRLVKASLG